LNPMGHDRVAQAVLETIELPFDPWFDAGVETQYNI
jgi:hypothetical protein